MSSRQAPACADWPLPVGDYMSWEHPLDVWQDGRCAFCGERDRLVRDHDHDSTLIRGLLCSGCNTAEPFEWRDAAWNLYREDCNPAAILGIREVYYPATLTVVDRARMRRRDADPDFQREIAWALL